MRNSKVIYWSPRILGIIFVLFLSLFALDVFSEYSGWQIILPLFIHLLPSLFLLLVIAVAWKYDLVGAVVFLFAAIFYVWMVGLGRPWPWYLVISGPAAITGILFLLSWLKKKKLGRF